MIWTETVSEPSATRDLGKFLTCVYQIVSVHFSKEWEYYPSHSQLWPLLDLDFALQIRNKEKISPFLVWSLFVFEKSEKS